MERAKVPCACCGCKTIDAGTYYGICPVCYWEDDWTQQNEPERSNGTNLVSLATARENYKQYGVSDLQFKEQVREPLEGEL